MAKKTTKTIQINKLVKMAFNRAFNDGNCYGFIDWFCKDSTLENKAKVLFSKVKAIANSNKFDASSCYVCFNNCSPIKGRLYDEFSICDIKSGDIVFTVVPKSGHSNKAEIWFKDDFESPSLTFDSWVKAKAWFKN